MTRRRAVAVRVTAAVAALCTVLGGCSSSSGGGSDSTSAPSPSSPATAGSTPAGSSSSVPSSAAPSTTSAAAARLLKIVLRASDLPSGYQTASTGGSSTAGDSGDVALAQCTGVSGVRAADETGSVASPNFSTSSSEVSSQASSYTSQAAVTRRTAVLQSAKIGSCLQTSLAKSYGTGSNGTALVGSKVTVTPGAGGGPNDIVAVATGSLSFRGSGKTATLYLAVAYVAGPKVTATAKLFQVGGPVPAALRTRVFAAVANRARQA